MAVDAGLGTASAATEPDPTVAPRAGPAAGRSRRQRRLVGALAWYLAMIFALVTLNFLIPRLMPGDPVAGLIGRGSAGFPLGDQALAKLKAYYRLDGSLMSQYGRYLANLARGDLGRSVVTNRPVTYEIAYRLPWTILLIVASSVLATAIGMVAGVRSGWRRDRPADRALLTGLLTLREFPEYLLASILLFLVGVKLRWLPYFGAETPFSSSFPLGRRIFDVAQHALMPVLVITVGLTVGSYLLMRAGMVNELGSDYLVMGRAKGLSERRIKYRYAARNALLPVVTATALQMAFAIQAVVLIERVFSYPGLGGLMFSSISQRDYPVIQGVFLLLAVIVVTMNALADALYRRLDPRTGP